MFKYFTGIWEVKLEVFIPVVRGLWYQRGGMWDIVLVG